MKKAIQWAICVLAALLAVEPSLAATGCGQRMRCETKVCPGCCGHMGGMPPSMPAMHCGQSEQGVPMAVRSDAPSILGARESICDSVVQELPQYTGAASQTGEAVLFASSLVGSATVPGLSFSRREDGSTDADGPPRYVLFRVFRI